MRNHYQRLTLGIVLLVNLVAVAYSLSVVWLITSFMLDHYHEATMPTWNWIILALEVAVAGVARAVLAGVVLFGINALLLRLARVSSWRIPLVSAGAAIAIMSGAAIVSSVGFAMIKIFM